ncbi:TetR/AcrR family transcriptional regulator [Nocardioides immobilis]|uniref:TetR/AcrR family transcriptional regulator n=1 Tax=Nocardioides immobilis TaxID=2049295 RepID=A0A417Y8M0_9ACTN|nr:TetR/AcrR family transcriptional regulator [Nocardioides immobilis]RHW29110.1 TetR/AcrR family transcriptional regulator [Nocardioides immobilis]
MMTHVKTTRRYDSTGRRARAIRTRTAILDAAERQFLDDGYGTATIASIAQEAGTSVETIYKSFGSKSGLVREIYERGLEGRGDTRAYDRSDEMRDRESDPRTIMREWGRLTAEVASVVTPIRLLMRHLALTDPEIAAVLEIAEAERLARMRHHARFLKARGHLRKGVTASEATDILWICSSLEIYELLVMRRGWSVARFARYVGDFMITALL